MTRAWLDVSVDYLTDALSLPNSCRIFDAKAGNGAVALLVEDPTIHPDAMRVKAIFERGSKFKEWRVTAKRQPLSTEAVRALGHAELAWSSERAAVVHWLRMVSRARDDRADPEWAEALSEAADYIEKGDHLNYFNSGAEPNSAIHSAGRPEPEASASSSDESCPLCCGPTDEDGMTLAASADTLPKGQDHLGLAGTESGAVAATGGETPGMGRP